MEIPFLDLRYRHRALRPRLDAAYRRVADSGQYIQGVELQRFEARFANYCGAHHCVGVGNGLDALSLILGGYGIGPGDEVIVPSNTYIATWLAVTAVGAQPVPAEPDSATCNLDADTVLRALTARTKAIIAVHLYGQCCDMSELKVIAQTHNLRLIEDAAQSVGGAWRGSRCGSLADAAGFSFFPTKNLGALGDGGAVTTSDEELATRVRQLGSYGGLVRNEHRIIGRNSRLDELQAAFLNELLDVVEDETHIRRELADAYHNALGEVDGISLQRVVPEVRPSWHLFTVRVADRECVRRRLADAGIGTAVHYPVPPHKTPAYAPLNLPAQPAAEEMARSMISLPLQPYLTTEQVEFVAAELQEAIQH